MWFDGGELAKFDDPTGALPDQLLRTEKNAAVVVDYSKDRPCPRCSGQVLHEHFARKTLGIEVNSCFACGGVWLDLGELELLRKDRAAINRMDQVIDDYEKKAFLPSVPRGLKAVLRLLFG